MDHLSFSTCNEAIPSSSCGLRSQNFPDVLGLLDSHDPQHSMLFSDIELDLAHIFSRFGPFDPLSSIDRKALTFGGCRSILVRACFVFFRSVSPRRFMELNLDRTGF